MKIEEHDIEQRRVYGYICHCGCGFSIPSGRRFLIYYDLPRRFTSSEAAVHCQTLAQFEKVDGHIAICLYFDVNNKAMFYERVDDSKGIALKITKNPNSFWIPMGRIFLD